jgi:hypothetical protein
MTSSWSLEDHIGQQFGGLVVFLWDLLFGGLI